MSAIERLDALDHGVLRFLTAGSVDDGKSTLIGRLLYDTKAILADQLAAIERTSQRRGQTLDLSLLTDGLLAELEGDMVVDRGDRLGWYEGPTLLQILETVEVPDAPASAPFRFPVQYVSRPTANGSRGYLGRIESDSIAVGDRVTVLPSGMTT